MERLNNRFELFSKARESLKKIIDKFALTQSDDPNYQEFRDSLIQRFEYSIDSFWKLLKEYIHITQAIQDIGSPKSILKLCEERSIISTEEYKIFIKMIDDRNMTSHAYNELLAAEIARAIPEYYKLMDTIAQRIHKHK